MWGSLGGVSFSIAHVESEMIVTGGHTSVVSSEGMIPSADGSAVLTDVEGGPGAVAMESLKTCSLMYLVHLLGGVDDPGEDDVTSLQSPPTTCNVSYGEQPEVFAPR